MSVPKKSHCRRGHEKTPDNTGSWGQCKICAAAYSRKWNKRNVDSKRDTYLRCEYGITLARFNDMLKEQDNKCAICKKEFVEAGKAGAHVDHIHDETKQVRGLLCHKCNIFISYAMESEEILLAAIEYLKKHKG